MVQDLILAIDQGTTGTTALLVDRALRVVQKATVDFEQVFPKPGYVEHRGCDIWTSVKSAVTLCLERAGRSADQVAAIGLTNQRETTGLFDKDGKLIHNFIVWQCRRTVEICEELRAKGVEALIRERTGLVLDPYFSATKLMWLFREYPHALTLAKKGELLFGTMDTWMLQRLSGGVVRATDATNASRTLLLNLATCDWDQELLDIFGIPAACLPTVRSSSEVYGYTKGLDFLPDGIPIGGMAGDQQAALFGQACLEPGEAKVTFGTGAFILMHTGTKRVISKHGLLTSVALRINNQTTFCLEGSAFIAGAAIQWLRDGLGIIKDLKEVETLAGEVHDSGGICFVPALSGLGAPFWRPEARGLLCGVSRGTTRAHIARALLEGIALQNADIIEAMRKDGITPKLLKVDGGASANDLLMQLQADMVNVKCARPANIEATAFGAAGLAGLGCGLINDISELKKAWKVDREFEPNLKEEQRRNHIAKWHSAVAKA